GFKNGANTPTEYTYDQNGNMLSDANKGIKTSFTTTSTFPLKFLSTTPSILEIFHTFTMPLAQNSKKLSPMQVL
ncbi:MAG: hypothetical protein CO119_11555, partial [Flavobacteriales bacterium CG_4_9_14_3_um_filter_40_17]